MKERFNIWSLLSAVLLLGVINACDPCDDCTSTSFEPTISVTFINADSLSKLNDSLSNTSQTSEALQLEITALNDTLLALTDSLTLLTDSIANGGDLETEKDSVELGIKNFGDERTLKSEEKTIQDSLITEINSVRSVILSGRLFVDQIAILETGSTLEYTDSASVFAVPLSLDKSFQQYEVTIKDELNTFELDYELFEELDARRNLLIRAQDIQVVTHSFDSLDACTENCNDGEATYTFYF